MTEQDDGAGGIGEQQGSDEPRAADGRVPGRRGRATRRRLLDRAAEMLETTSYRDLKVVDIAREVGTSPATFYQYFPDVEAAMIVLGEEMVDAGVEIFRELTAIGNWDGPEGYEQVENLTRGFLAFWERHLPVMRVVNLATDEGDERFADMRIRLLGELNRTLAEAVAARQRAGAGQRDVDPQAVSGVMVAMLAHVSAHRRGFEFWGVETRELRRMMSRIIYWSVTGQAPPA